MKTSHYRPTRAEAEAFGLITFLLASAIWGLDLVLWMVEVAS